MLHTHRFDIRVFQQLLACDLNLIHLLLACQSLDFRKLVHHFNSGGNRLDLSLDVLLSLRQSQA